MLSKLYLKKKQYIPYDPNFVIHRGMHKQLGKKQFCQESHLLWLSLGHKLQVVFFFFNRVHFYSSKISMMITCSFIFFNQEKNILSGISSYEEKFTFNEDHLTHQIKFSTSYT